MNTQLSLSIIEIIVLMAGAIMLGITIHFFIVSRRSLKASSPHTSIKINKELEERKLRYLNDIEWKQKEVAELHKQLEDEKGNTEIYAIEAEELRKQNKRLLAEMETLRSAPKASEKSDYIERLRLAQTSLMEYNQRISELLEQADFVKEAEEKQRDIERSNEVLYLEVENLRQQLTQRDTELNAVQHRQELTSEMSSMLDNAYSEFTVLQEKLRKLEGQVNASKRMNLDYEDIREENFKLSKDLEEQKAKLASINGEKKELEAAYAESEEKLREANFQRQQLKKRVAYLEELNNDMQSVAAANKSLESQIKRIGELESMLHMLAEERDELAKKQNL